METLCWSLQATLRVTGYPDPADEVPSPPASPVAEAANGGGEPTPGLDEAGLHDSFLEDANRLLPKARRRCASHSCRSPDAAW